MLFTAVFWKNIDAINDSKRILINRGGSSSSKTISIMQILRVIAEEKENQYILLIARSVPKLKTTLLKDFKTIIMGNDYDSKRFIKQDNEYNFANGSIFKFANAYDEDTYKGVRSDYAFLDECNTYRNGKGVFDQIEIRCKTAVFLAFNPSAKFWVTDVMAREDAVDIHSTYHDNEFLEQSIIDTLELRSKTDENFYRVYVLGDWGVLEGLVFDFKKNWDYYSEEPENYDNEYYGGDFGFTNHQTATVRVRVDRATKTVYVKQYLYGTGLLNSHIAKAMKPIIGKKYIIFDSNEAKSIASLRNEHKLNTLGAVKGPDSVRVGINRMKEWLILIQDKSGDVINEFFSYQYVDKDGLTNEPIDKDNHAIDAIRYVFLKYRL